MIGVIGNEACDADSIVSAIALATWKHQIPFVNLSIDELDSRLDFSSICEIVQINDPVEFFHIRSSNDSVTDITGWIVVDHNNPLPSIHPVLEVVDHHEILSNVSRELLARTPHTVEPVGSCATLVAERILSDSHFCETQIGRKILHMLLLTIVLDTQNFSSAIGKTTAKDRAIVASICGILKIESSILSESFARMRDAKFNPNFWYKPGNEEKILKYDYKEFETGAGEIVGISTILRKIDHDLVRAVHRLRGDKKLYIVGAGYRENGVVLSQLLIVGDLEDDVVRQLEIQFNLVPVSSDSGRLFQVEDPTFSRKKFAPFLVRLLDENVS